MEIELAGTTIRTAPWDPPTSWGQIYIPAPEPLVVEAGASYRARVVPAMTRDWQVEWTPVLPARHFLQ